MTASEAPGKGAGGLPCMGYMGMCCCEGHGFQAVYSGIGYINQKVWVQNRVSFSRKLIKRFPILVQTRETGIGIATRKYKKIKSVLFWLDCTSDLSSSWKTATLGQGRFGEFSLVQGWKILLNQLWYRPRVPGSPKIPKVSPGFAVY